MKKETKEFNVLCHLNDNNEPVYHKIIVTETGDICLKGHPDLKAEFYYHLLHLKEESAKKNSWYRFYYTVPTCLKFYFSIIKSKFYEHVKDVRFETTVENNSAFMSSAKNVALLKDADNERLEYYLAKFLSNLSNKKAFKFNKPEPFDENKAVENFQKRIIKRLQYIATDSFHRGIDTFEDYRNSVHVTILPKDREISLRSGISTRKRESWRRRFSSTGNIDINIDLPQNWYKDVYKKGLSIIYSEKHGRLAVVEAKETAPHTFIVKAICKKTTGVKEFELKTFEVKTTMTGIVSQITRKNRKTEKNVAISSS